MNIPVILRYSIIAVLNLVVVSCSSVSVVKDEQDSAPDKKVDVSEIGNAVPRSEPRSKYGNPKSYVVFGKRYYVMESGKGYVERGIASWYGKKFHGRRTSSGETYDMYAMTAAHKSLPLPAYVSVKNLENGRSIVVRVNDRGPFHEGRIIDLSYTAALKLDVVRSGTAQVEVRSIDTDSNEPVITSKEPAPEVIKTGYSQNGFYIQAGSFSILDNANTLQQKLSSTSAHMVSIKPVLLNGNHFYRVLIGPVNNIDVADKIILKLEDYGIYNPKFVSN